MRNLDKQRLRNRESFRRRKMKGYSHCRKCGETGHNRRTCVVEVPFCQREDHPLCRQRHTP
jgi:ribosomal protein L32